MICPYPPGIPVAAPGERLTDAADETLEQFRVVAA
jgi:arginine/lysine/ornithine decarboxylase